MNKVLVIEDNSLNRKLFCDLLKLQKCNVITSPDGINVIELTKREKPNLILMDIQLSGISGLDVIRELKNNNMTKTIPIIAITAFAMKNDETMILDSGCDMYLSKPVSIDNFFNSIRKFINIEFEL